MACANPVKFVAKRYQIAMISGPVYRPSGGLDAVEEVVDAAAERLGPAHRDAKIVRQMVDTGVASAHGQIWLDEKDRNSY